MFEHEIIVMRGFGDSSLPNIIRRSYHKLRFTNHIKSQNIILMHTTKVKIVSKHPPPPTTQSPSSHSQLLEYFTRHKREPRSIHWAYKILRLIFNQWSWKTHTHIEIHSDILPRKAKESLHITLCGSCLQTMCIFSTFKLVLLSFHAFN